MLSTHGLLSSLGRRLSKYIHLFVTKRSLARILSTLLCSIVIVIRPFSRLGGNYPFLALALKELVFSVQGNLAQQLELTVLNIMGALLGIGISTLAKFGASRYPLGSAAGRAICTVTLIAISFFAGLIKSRLPRLQLSTRISCFVSIWILTLDIGVPSRVLPDGGAFLWVTLTAAIICLFSLVVIMLPFRWASTNFENDIASSFSLLHQCLSIALTSNFSDTPPSSIDRDAHRALQAELLTKTIKLNENYSQAAFELRTGRLSLRSIRPLIGNIEHLRRELAWGMPLKQSPNLHRRDSSSQLQEKTPDVFKAAIGPTALCLGHAVLNTMRCIESTVLLAYHRKGSAPPLLPPFASLTGPRPILKSDDLEWMSCQLMAIQSAEAHLIAAKNESHEELSKLYEDIRIGEDIDGSPVQVPKDVYDGSLAMIALIQMAEEMLAALHVAERLVRLCMESHSRLWYPRISLAWFGVVPGPFISDDPSASLSVGFALDGVACPAETHISDAERRQGLAEHALQLTAGRLPKATAAAFSVSNGRPKWSWRRFGSFLEWLWVNDRSIIYRLRLSSFLSSLKNSDHLHHAMKAGVGVAILTFPAFMPNGSAGYRWYTTWHGQWMTISYLWVLETNTGATWRTGYLRILGTCIGALYAFVTWSICRVNPYGLVVMVTAADIPITWLITKTNLTPLAVPCSVALPPIVFAKYITPQTTQSIFDLALLRALMITAGMIAALLMNSLVFPRHCRVIFLSDTSRTMGLLSNLYLTLSHEMFHAKHTFARDDRRKTLKLELETRNALYRLSALITTMKDELGLLPKPLRHYRKVVTDMQKILDLLTGLRKIRENIPRQETVLDVFKERRAFMSCVCIVLFACQHVFRTREPLPQFLPSARNALSNLESHVHDSLRKARKQDSHAFGVSLVYAFAEQETMRNMVNTLEALLELSGRLFGTSAWLTQDASWSTSTVVDEGSHGWYSTLKWEDA